MFNTTFTIAHKELKDALRDRNSLFAAALYALMGPLMLWLMLSISATEATKVTDKDISLVGPDPQAMISSFLANEGFTFTDGAPVRVILAANLADSLAQGRQGGIRIEADMSKSRDTVRALEKALMSFAGLVADQRLLTRGMTPGQVHPLDIQIENSSGVSPGADKFIGLLAVIFFLPVAFTGMSLSIDMTAGERERLSFEPLLAQPVTTASIMAGKWLVSFLVALAGSGLAITVSGLILSYMPLVDIGLDIHLGLVTGLKIFMYFIPLAAVFAALQLALALYAKSYKEGITYLGVLGLTPMAVSFLKDETLAKYDFLPLFWEVGALKQTLLENSDSIIMPNGAILISIAITVGCIFYAQWRLKQEVLLN